MIYADDIRRKLEDLEYDAHLRDTLRALLDSPEARRLGAWGSAASADVTYFSSGDVRSIELLEVSDAGDDQGYASFELEADASYEFPVLIGEAFGEDDVELLPPVDLEHMTTEAERTVRLVLQVDATYDAETGDLQDFEVTSGATD